MSWRVGSETPWNVYDGDRPVCQCVTAEDAALIVSAANDDNAEIADLRSRLEKAEAWIRNATADTGTIQARYAVLEKLAGPSSLQPAIF